MISIHSHRDAIRRLAQVGDAAGVKLVRTSQVDSGNRYLADEVEFDSDGSTKLASQQQITVTNLAEPATSTGQVPADTEAVAIDVEGRWVVFVREAGAAVLSAKVISSLGSAAYTVREQTVAPNGTFSDKSGAQDLTARNLAELSMGPGAAVGNGTIVLVTTMKDTGTPPTPRYFFDHPAYAKYLD